MSILFRREPLEPPHIHVEEEESYAKFWLNPIQLAASYGFSSHELRKIGRIIEENVELLRRSWDEFFK